MGMGTTLFASTSGSSSPLTFALLAHGFDHMTTGLKTALSGRPQASLTTLTLQSAGLSANHARLIDNSIAITAPAAAAFSFQKASSIIPRFADYLSKTLADPSNLTKLKNRLPVYNQTFSQKTLRNSYLSKNPLQNTKYSDKVLLQMSLNSKTAQSDFHGFPRILDNYAGLGKKELIKGGDGTIRTKISLNGGYKNQNGHFEWIINPDNTVNHRIFVPY